jgi:Heparinase II/III-like protein.
MAQSIESSIIEKLNPEKVECLKNSSLVTQPKQVAKELLEIYRKKPTLYLSLSESDMPLVRQRFPQNVAKSIEVADQVRKHYFVFRYDWDMEKTNVPYQFLGDVEWNKIPFNDPEWCFMLNRHRYWIDLGKAYFLTKNEKYAKVWVQQVTDWIKKNPVNDKSLRGFTWRRIEAGIRCENWIKTWEYMKNSPAITPEFFCLFLNSLYEHAEYLNSAFSSFSKSSNWGILEFQGLFNASLFLSEFKQSEVWQKDALHNLEVCAGIQVLDDGVQWEQSPMYHNEVFHCLMNVVMLGKKANIAIPELIRQKAFDMAWANVQWQKPNYHQPLIGDSDDTDLRGLFTLAAWLYSDGGLKSRAYPEMDYETLFLLGENQNASYKKMEVHSPSFLSVYQPNGGDMFMRNSWDEGADYLQLHLKKIGCGHAHDDLLHISLFANNRDYLVDGGRYTYEDWKEREQVKMSTGHNGLGVDGLTNSVYANSWDNSFNAKTEGIYTKMSPLFDYAEAQNTGYYRLDDPVSMTRRVLYLKPGLWLIFDSFTAKESHKYSQYFNFPDRQVKADSNRVVTTYGKNDLVIEAIKPATIKLEDSRWSPEYNLLKENTKAEFFTNVKGSYLFITALYFTEQKKIAVTQIPVYDRNDVKVKDSIAEAVEIIDGDKEFVIMVVNNRQSPKAAFYKIKGVYVTGEVVLLEKDKDRYVKHLIKE